MHICIYTWHPPRGGPGRSHLYRSEDVAITNVAIKNGSDTRVAVRTLCFEVCDCK